MKILVVKGTIAPRPAYEPVAAKIIEVDSPGVTAVNPAHFVFKNVSFTGPGAFLKVDLAHYGSDSTVSVEHCFLNGRPVTAADFPNVPQVTIQP